MVTPEANLPSTARKASWSRDISGGGSWEQEEAGEESLAGGDVSMNDPLRKWITVAHLYAAKEAVTEARPK